MFEKVQRLLNLAEKTFGQLADAEKKLFEAAVTEKIAEYGTNKNEQEISSCQQKTILQADRIRWLCTDTSARKFVGSFGIRIIGAKIEKTLDLQYDTFDFPCFLKAVILMSRSS
jgi:hypothetical protein